MQVASDQATLTLSPSLSRLERELVRQHGEAHRPRILRGLAQVVAAWRAADGSAADFETFVVAHFVADAQAVDALCARLEFVLESVYGHMAEIGRDLRWQADLDLGPLLPIDAMLSGYDAAAHFIDDAFSNRLAFVVLLNFPIYNLEQRLQMGGQWSRADWAQVRLADLFAKRIPAEVQLAIADAAGRSSRYIASYNIWAHHLLDDRGQRLFEPGKKLLTHWNLRDELKSRYSQGKAGLDHQRMICKVMERIIDQTIPSVVIDSPWVDWNPYSNAVQAAAVHDSEQPAPHTVKISNEAEPDTRYQMLLDCFRAARQLDPCSPTAPTHMARSFGEGRQIPEARAVQMLEELCSSPQVGDVARLIERRLGRPLESFDIWYSGFRPGAELDEAGLDGLTRCRYPNAPAFKDDMAAMLRRLGFSADRSEWLASRIEVDPARGSGHAMGAARKGDNARLRTRIGEQGMDYKGFNIAVHEMGHNVEQTFSLNRVDRWLLNGVPNTAFTEAIAFVFQARDLQLLGQENPSPGALAEKTLNEFWSTFEIAGVGLIDTKVWHWMYDHPDADAAQLKAAVIQISKEVWNRFYAPYLGHPDCMLLGIYSHLIDSFLYLPDYAIGHMIARQIEQQIEDTGNLGEEVERMTTLGRLTPDLWMLKATGSVVGPQALMDAAAKALQAVRA